VLQARLDGLPLAERVVVQQASVVGRTFWCAALQALQGTDEAPARELATLCRRDVIHRLERSTFADTDEYQFKHALMRDAAYNTVLVRTRRAYHGLAASWLAEETEASGRCDEYAGVIAEHYELAGELEEAAAWYLQAGEAAKAQGAPSEARTFLDRALQLLPQSDLERRWRALLARDEVLGTLGETDARMADDEALVVLALELEDDGKLAHAYVHQGTSFGVVGKYQEQLETYQRALAAARRAGNRQAEALVLGLKVACLTRLGEEDQARRVAEEALACAKQLGDENILVRNLTNASLVYAEYGDLGHGALLLEEQVTINHRLANREGEAVGLSNLGYVYVQLGRYAQAIDALERGVELSLAIGHRLHGAYSRLNLALAHQRNGDLAAATRVLEPAIPELETLNDRFGQAVAQSYRALIQAAHGEHSDALEHFLRAESALDELGVHGHANDAAAGAVRCLLALGKSREAKQQAEALWAYLSNSGPGGMEFPLLAYQTCADLFAAVGDAERSRTAIEKGYRELLDRAEKISDLAWRFSFLENVPENRAITEKWRGG
jgi:tetratricopeptide (TPR) repeat protein